jgi:ABC-2 type transport system permease protein
MVSRVSAGRPEATTSYGGSVFDIGYQRYTGPRAGRGRARLAIYKDGLRNALGLGRSVWAKLLPWLFLSLLVLVALVMALIAGAVQRLIGTGAVELLNLPSHSDYYGIASIILFVFAAAAAPELLCPDRRNGTLSLYLVRPVTGSDYILARWAALLTVLTIAALVPQLVLLLGLTMGGPEPVRYLLDNWRDLPRLLLAGTAIAVYTGTLAMLTASFTTRRAYASVFLVGLFAITTPFTTGLADQVGGTAGQWISMFNLSNIPVHVNDMIFGKTSRVTSGALASELPGSVRLAWYFLWTIGPGLILWNRYRRVAP